MTTGWFKRADDWLELTRRMTRRQRKCHAPVGSGTVAKLNYQPQEESRSIGFVALPEYPAARHFSRSPLKAWAKAMIVPAYQAERKYFVAS